eukprot:3373334-Pleurochrysis_carterae.AAC.2
MPRLRARCRDCARDAKIAREMPRLRARFQCFRARCQACAREDEIAHEVPRLHAECRNRA